MVHNFKVESSNETMTAFIFKINAVFVLFGFSTDSGISINKFTEPGCKYCLFVFG